MVGATHWAKTWTVRMVEFMRYPVHVLHYIPVKPQQRSRRGSMNILEKIQTRRCLTMPNTVKLERRKRISPSSTWKMFTPGESILCLKGNICGIQGYGESSTFKKLYRLRNWYMLIDCCDVDVINNFDHFSFLYFIEKCKCWRWNETCPEGKGCHVCQVPPDYVGSPLTIIYIYYGNEIKKE